jgi:ribosomal protein S18 acetylase RimI-like enzyme
MYGNAADCESATGGHQSRPRSGPFLVVRDHPIDGGDQATRLRRSRNRRATGSLIDNDCRVQLEVRPASLSDLDRASIVLGEAFADYAWTRWTVDPDDHLQRIIGLQRIALGSFGLPFGHVWVGIVEDIVQSAAVWMNSANVVPSSVNDRVHLITAELEGRRHEASIAAGREVNGWRPVERHYYLATVGTTPGMQGRGLASAVLRPVLRTADDENVCGFLETSSASNIAFYSTLGFEVTDYRQISGGGPHVWAMLRRPQAG